MKFNIVIFKNRTPLLMVNIMIFFMVLMLSFCDKPVKNAEGSHQPEAWEAPDTLTISKGETGDQIRYGRELLAHTAKYFGPKGSVARITNGMNCQNCHLDAGTRLFGNNFASFISSYPKVSNRSNHLTKPADRIAECFERSLNGKMPDTNSREAQAMLAYMKWVGKDVKKGSRLIGNASGRLPYLERAADPAKGATVYLAKCKNCHGADGSGILAADKVTYTYPPLWGNDSYNDAAGMYRLSNVANFVKNNMPFGVTYKNPQLTDNEAWDVAAYIVSQPRPHRDQSNDWTDLRKKPIDFPFGPYLDNFTEHQHKFGPYTPIQKTLENKLK